MTFKGSGIGPTQAVSALPDSDGFYPTQLSGTSVRFNGVAAPLLYTSATQVSAVVPYGVTGPLAQVTVTYQDQTSVPATIQIFAAAPGLFTADGTGSGQAAAINQDGTVNNAFHPAAIGSVISLYATGGGQTSPAGVDGQVSTSPLAAQLLPVQVYIGQRLILSAAQLEYAGPAPSEIAGLMQVNVPLPAGLKTGSTVPVSIIVGTAGAGSQSNVTIAMRRFRSRDMKNQLCSSGHLISRGRRRRSRGNLSSQCSMTLGDVSSFPSIPVLSVPDNGHVIIGLYFHGHASRYNAGLVFRKRWVEITPEWPTEYSIRPNHFKMQVLFQMRKVTPGCSYLATRGLRRSSSEKLSRKITGL